MIDVHSHILPHMDDGSRSTAESLSMLEAAAAQNIRVMACTPHFYAWENSPEEFLERRTASVERMKERWTPGLPEVKLGAEVCYFEGMSRSGALEALRLEGTQLLLLELPFAPWTERMLREVRDLQERPGIAVLLAHIERYLRIQPPGVWDVLREAGVLSQCNASFFLHWRTRGRARRMLKAGEIHLLGSDCHNMDLRPPRLGDALARLGEQELELLRHNQSTLLPDW